jgi:serine/threonine protein kinase
VANLVAKTLLKRYRVDEFLGRGGMAEVYRAWDIKRSVYVALKVLNEDLAEDYVFLNRFTREARALELLQHPNIVRLFGFEESQGVAFLVMEYIDGVTLRRQLKLLERPLTLPEALTVLQPVCSALHYAHQKKIYHCDVKPANIFVERGGRVVLGDFGIARLSESVTVTSSTPGTPAYMTPEQCRGEKIDARTDVYSLGVTTYEILTLDRPFKGDTEDTTGSRGERVRWEQMHLAPLPPRRVNPDIPHTAEAAILRALEKAPERRQQGSVAFYEELCRGIEVNAGAIVPWIKEPREALSNAPPPEATRQPSVSLRNPLGLLVVLGGIGILLFVVFFFALASRRTVVDNGGAVKTIAAQLTTDARTAITQATLDAGMAWPNSTAESVTATAVALAAAETSLAKAASTQTASTASLKPSPAATSTPTPTKTPTPTPSFAPSSTAVTPATPPEDIGLRWRRLGNSVQNREIRMAVIGDENGRTSVVMVGALDAMQTNTRDLVTTIVDYFDRNLHTVPDHTALYLIPSINPDGEVANSRYNAHGVDINRNWNTDDWTRDPGEPGHPQGKSGAGGAKPFSEPETRALRDLLQRLKAEGRDVLVIVLHSSVTLSRGSGKVFPGSTIRGLHQDSVEISKRFVREMGYQIDTNWDDYSTQGELLTWCAEQDIDSMDVVFSKKDLASSLQADFVRALLVIIR